MVMYIWRRWKASGNKEEFTAKQKAHAVPSSAMRIRELLSAMKDTFNSNGGQRYAKIASDKGCQKSTICQTIK